MSLIDFLGKKVLVAGVAKNEAAYLPEWIFHHLRLGFHSARIYVNGTSDNTIRILDSISQEHPVTYRVCDSLLEKDEQQYMHRLELGFLLRNPLQARAYAEIYDEMSQGDVDYVLFLDIDEYFYPRDVPYILGEGMQPTPVTLFPWFGASGESEEFGSLAAVRRGEWDSFTKCMVRTSISSMRIIDPHVAEVPGMSAHRTQSAFIVHRSLRSKREYLAILSKSANVHNTMALGLKRNRRGWGRRGGVRFVDSSNVLRDYDSQFDQFVDETGIHQEIMIAREGVISQAESVARQIKELNRLNVDLFRVLPGTGAEHLSVKRVVVERWKWALLSSLLPGLRYVHMNVVDFLKCKLEGLFRSKTHEN